MGIVEDICQYLSVDSGDTVGIDKVLNSLADLLKTLACDIGHNATSQMHRDVMVFIYRRRWSVAISSYILIKCHGKG